MKIALALIAVLFAAAVAGLTLQASTASRLTSEKAELEALVALQKKQIGELEQAREKLEADARIYVAESAQLREKLASRETVAPAPEAEVSTDAAENAPEDRQARRDDRRQGWQKFLENPQAREAMRKQVTFGVRQNYADLARELALTPEQASAFYETLAARHSGFMQRDEEKIAPEETAKRLREVLGDAGYAKYEGYNKTLGERKFVNQVRQDLAGSGAPLQEGQFQTLMQVIGEEKARQPAVEGFEGGDSRGGFGGMRGRSAEAVQQYVTQQEELLARTVSRARNFLVADQVAALEEQGRTQLDMVKAGAALMQTRNRGGDR